MKTDKLHKTIETLFLHNEWRRGNEEIEMQSPLKIGIAIDHAVHVLKAVESLLKQRGRHNTEIAYKALEISAAGK